jgi:membrane-associated phospholipid phosphatase
MELWAKYFSYFLVPPVMNFYLFLILSKHSSNPNFVVAVAVFFGFILPVTFFIYMRKKKRIVDNDATIKEERTVPYLFGALFCSLALGVSYLAHSERLFLEVWFIYILTSLLIAVINKFWKISAHAMGAAIPLGVLIYLNDYWFLLFIFFLVLVSSSRLILKVHTPAQVFFGGLLGSILPIVVLWLVH